MNIKTRRAGQPGTRCTYGTYSNVSNMIKSSNTKFVAKGLRGDAMLFSERKKYRMKYNLLHKNNLSETINAAKTFCEYFNLITPVWLCTYVWSLEQSLCFADVTGSHRDQCCLWYMHSVYTQTYRVSQKKVDPLRLSTIFSLGLSLFA